METWIYNHSLLVYHFHLQALRVINRSTYYMHLILLYASFRYAICGGGYVVCSHTKYILELFNLIFFTKCMLLWLNFIFGFNLDPFVVGYGK